MPPSLNSLSPNNVGLACCHLTREVHILITLVHAWMEHQWYIPFFYDYNLYHNSNLINHLSLFSFSITHDNQPYQSYNKSYVHIFSYCLSLEKIHAHNFVPHFLRYVLLFFAIFVNIFVMWWETKHISYIALFRTWDFKTHVSLETYIYIYHLMFFSIELKSWSSKWGHITNMFHFLINNMFAKIA